MHQDIKPYIKQGIRHQEAAEYEKAWQQYSRAIHILEESGTQTISDAETADLYLRRGVAFLADNEQNSLADTSRFHQILDDFDQAIDLNPAMPAYRILRGRLYMNNTFADYSEQAKIDFQTILQAVPQHTEALRNMGELLSKSGEYAEALGYLSRALQEEDDLETRVLRGVCLFRKTPPDYRAALIDFEYALEADPQRETLYLWRAQCQQELGEIHLAISTYNDLIRMVPNNPDYLVDRGFLRTESDPDGAVEDYNKALHIVPHPMAYNNRANYFRQQGNLQAALTDAEAALEVNPGFPIAYATLAEIYADIGDEEQLRIYLELALKHFYEDTVDVIMDPTFESYRTEPWFLELMRKY